MNKIILKIEGTYHEVFNTSDFIAIGRLSRSYFEQFFYNVQKLISKLFTTKLFYIIQEFITMIY
jgi:hypothetical protein